MAEPLATLTRMNALEMDSEGRIIEVVLGTEFQTMTDERAIIKLGLKTGAGTSHGKSVQATIRFVIQPVILHSFFDSLDRLASERTASLSQSFNVLPTIGIFKHFDIEI